MSEPILGAGFTARLLGRCGAFGIALQLVACSGNEFLADGIADASGSGGAAGSSAATGTAGGSGGGGVDSTGNGGTADGRDEVAVTGDEVAAKYDASNDGTGGASMRDASVDDTSATDGGDGNTSDASRDTGASDVRGEAQEAGPALDDSGATTPPSCRGLAANCGPEGKASCCTSPLVTGGAFKRSSLDAYPAIVRSFRLDAYEISVGRFRRFVESYPGSQPGAGSGRNPNNPSDPGWDAAWNAPTYLPGDAVGLVANLKCNAAIQTWTDLPGNNENRPLACLSWYMAQAFCIWDGGRLPTEAEWNYGAAGGSEQRVFPWSVPPYASTVDETYASYSVDPTKQCRGDGVDGCSVNDLIVVGSKPNGNGRWGHADLGGNLWELVQDSFADPYAITSCQDCADLTSSTGRIIRGGSYDWDSPSMYTATRRHSDAIARWADVGARCARAP